ncbi:hypothetical protein NQ315_000354 [Exocentrus adspersus]|uniref:GBD/FH3 domain-containing protein n=1 Tax=Exocentrus adspersus TaxID=1586481 RepID=A0AAV8VLI4_9CUCU|nr:hypothetical protein NQ315_000354 [Exocentrus adspersus]
MVECVESGTKYCYVKLHKFGKVCTAVQQNSGPVTNCTRPGARSNSGQRPFIWLKHTWKLGTTFPTLRITYDLPDNEFFESASSMPPNSEETRIGRFPFADDATNREKQRPPIYNPEDYAILLKKWGKKSANGMISMYSNSSTSEIDCPRSRNGSFRDYRNPMLTSSGSEMTLRQFGTVSELLAKLKSDLKLAYPSFVQEFIADPLDGVGLLLDLLRAIQLSQSNNVHGQPGSAATVGKVPPSVQRRTLLDELSCLQCLLSCCVRYSEAIRKLTATSAGLFTLAICIMSNVNKSRIIALQLLGKACELPVSGHAAVSEAMSTLRLRFGEPVRFRFLVGMLSSTGGQKELLLAGMRFLNRFLDTAGSAQKRLYIQAELEQAGFDIETVKKNTCNLNANDPIVEEITHWEKNSIDVEKLTARLQDVDKENDTLRDKVLLLERKVQILQEEKGILLSLEKCLKERCSELQGEVHSLQPVKSQLGSTLLPNKKGGSTPEDEGISSSERSLTPEDDIQQESSVYELYSPTVQPAPPQVEDEEEETTIEEVIEELRNIINDAETEVFKNEETEQRRRIEEAQAAAKLDADDYVIVTNENEIVPSNLHPQPPRKARSLMHLFIPAEDYDYCNKEMFFENETAFTSEEGSDSLLSASKCLEKDQAQEVRRCKRNSSRTSVKRSESFKPAHGAAQYYTTLSQQKERQRLQELTSQRTKCKSLDRIDDGLDTLVDIVVTNQPEEKSSQCRSKSDSGNITSTSLCRSVSNVFTSTKKDGRSRLSTHSEEKQKMFLPPQREQAEIPYYFPRVQEKRSSSNTSFMIKRGHTNAGLYSGHGQVIMDSHSMMVSKSKEFCSSSRMCGKVTDLPSGLY